ncbi:MAG: formate dehydrogenase accessory sulfurtransferase FdhD [Sulfobacillus sp.]
MAQTGVSEMAEVSFQQPTTTDRMVLHLSGTEGTWVRDKVVTEWPLTLYLNGEEFVTLVASPDHLDELVTGFLASEGVIQSLDQIRRISFDPETGDARAELAVDTAGLKDKLFARRYITSCCGKGRAAIYFDNDYRTAKAVASDLTVTPGEAQDLIAKLQESSDVFRATGGVHNACFATPEEGIWVARSDIGRHNALDKLYGWSMIHGRDVTQAVVAFSGRVSSEILLKVSKMQIPIVLSKSAPTELALAMAEDLGITVVGFIRGDRLNVYTHVQRVVLA